MKDVLKTTALAALLGAGALAITASSASAEIVCDSAGDCWHVRDHYTYPYNVGIVVHPDDWRWDVAPSDTTVHYRWREHEGRGYWRDGVWVTF
jgi:hypothetical protein